MKVITKEEYFKRFCNLWEVLYCHEALMRKDKAHFNRWKEERQFLMDIFASFSDSDKAWIDERNNEFLAKIRSEGI